MHPPAHSTATQPAPRLGREVSTHLRTVRPRGVHKELLHFIGGDAVPSTLRAEHNEAGVPRAEVRVAQQGRKRAKHELQAAA